MSSGAVESLTHMYDVLRESMEDRCNRPTAPRGSIHTVAKAKSSDQPPNTTGRWLRRHRSRRSRNTRALLAVFPEAPAMVLAERVGWAASPSWFRENLA